MALTPDPLERATQAARTEEPEGWIELSESIMTKVRSAVTPAEPILAFDAAVGAVRDAEGSRTFVSSRVVSAALRRVLQGESTHAPDRLRLQVDDGRLVAVDIAIVASYGVDLVALADAIRQQVLRELVSLIGPDPEIGPGQVSIEVVDVVVGDPRTV